MEQEKRITEQPSRYDHLERMTVAELLQHINEEDQVVAQAVAKSLPSIAPLVEAVVQRMKHGGRLFYVGADRIIGIIAGGDRALRHAVERAEDSAEQGWKDLLAYHPITDDTVIGIAASGTTPYVVGALREARQHGLLTGCITNNPETPLAAEADYPIEVIVGPEFVTGSTRMKSGTAQKMVLNMISTTLMIRLGRVEGNRMVKMQLTNNKLIDRGTRMLQDYLGLDYTEARRRLLHAGSVDKALKDKEQ